MMLMKVANIYLEVRGRLIFTNPISKCFMVMQMCCSKLMIEVLGSKTCHKERKEIRIVPSALRRRQIWNTFHHISYKTLLNVALQNVRGISCCKCKSGAYSRKLDTSVQYV